MKFQESYKYILIQNPTMLSINDGRFLKIQNDMDIFHSFEEKGLYYPVIFLVVMQIIMSGGAYLLLNEYISEKIDYMLALIALKKSFFNESKMINAWLVGITASSFIYLWFIPLYRFLYSLKLMVNVKSKKRAKFFWSVIYKILGKGAIRVKVKVKRKMNFFQRRLFHTNQMATNEFNVFNIVFSIYTRPRNTRDWFLFFAINIIMVFSFAIFMKGHSYMPDYAVKIAFYIIIFLPMILFLFMMIFICAYLIARSKSFKKHETDTSNSRAIVSLISLLVNVESYFYNKYGNIDDILEDIYRVKVAAIAIGSECVDASELNIMINSRVNLLVNYIDEMKLDIILPNEFSEQRVREKVIFLINSFVETKYGLVTKEAALNKIDLSMFSETSVKKNNFISLLYLSLLISFPILAWMIAGNVLKFQVDEVSKTLLAILYTIWSVLCVISHLHKLAPEAKELVMGTIQMFIPKGTK